MECNKDEALRAKEIAERKFQSRDLQGAKKFALKAKALFPDLEGIVQMITTLDVYLTSEVKIAGGKDWYSILSVDMSADDETLKKQYRKLVLQLHPDKNKSVGAEGAFQMVQEAWTVLSDKTKRALFDQKMKLIAMQQRTSQSNKTTPPPAAQPTFWTSCNRCKMNFEYLREYLNRNLLCPSCREPFIAKEVPMPPPEVVQAVRDSNIRGATEDASTGRKFQWGLFSRTAGPASATASSAAGVQAANMVQQTYEKVKREREEAQAAARREEALQRKHNPLKRKGNVSENVNHGMGDVASGKKMKTVGNDAGVGSSSILSGPWANYVGTQGGTIPFSTNSGAFEFQGANGVIPNWRPRPSTRISITRTFSKKDIRSILIDKMKSDLMENLKEIRSKPLQVTVNGKASEKHVVNEHVEGNETLASDDSTANKDVCADPEEKGSANSADAENEDDNTFSYTVPDPDFHDFDKDRTEESFQSDQIWASYDDEDGMPRYYAYIQKVISLTPFKVKISYLASRTNSEFGPLNWASSGFIKTCGDFRIGKYETVDIINMFSHQIKWEKGPRGVVKIYPRKGDIWALYRNWSPDWNGDTPDNVLHVYDLVEVQDDYDEDNGISVIPLIKLTGFRTVFQHHQDRDVIKRIPKGEMFRFSHQVPFYRMSGEEAPNVPKGSYEVDPAAISKELLQGITETVKEAEGTSKC
ncbi:unnamed protein product [Triticum turgidum subsp. durum]|uniref:J domain-containing protein n=1 Tax=Triticum turgidum subsp. durum TaxID=4567 RepID=A0A9R0WFQ0_TRITD|nr:unnamed protein product [Triticum turgidum subsp. durum]